MQTGRLISPGGAPVRIVRDQSGTSPHNSDHESGFIFICSTEWILRCCRCRDVVRFIFIFHDYLDSSLLSSCRFLSFFLFVICFSHVCPDSPEPVRGVLTGVGICASSHLGLCLGVLGRFVIVSFQTSPNSPEPVRNQSGVSPCASVFGNARGTSQNLQIPKDRNRPTSPESPENLCTVRKFGFPPLTSPEMFAFPPG